MTVREDGEAQLCRQAEADTPGLVQDHDHPSLTVFHEPAATGVLSGRRAMLVMAAGVAIALCAVVIAGIMLADAASTTNFDARNLAPSFDHPFGTDWMGRDMLARTLAGLSTSVVVGLVAATVSSVIALALASAAALGGSRVDAVVSWLIDLTMGIPHMVLLLAMIPLCLPHTSRRRTLRKKRTGATCVRDHMRQGPHARTCRRMALSSRYASENARVATRSTSAGL